PGRRLGPAAGAGGALPLAPPPPAGMAGRDFRLDGRQMELAWIPPGTSVMGNAEGDEDERVTTRVTISRGFWLGKDEVTQGQWDQVMSDDPSGYRDAGPTVPVENVTWYEAMAFCHRLTESEGAAGGRLRPGCGFPLPTRLEG